MKELKLYRKDIKTLIDWSNNSTNIPLLVLGGRSVGKTFLIKDLFAQQYFNDNYTYINLKNQEVLKESLSKCNNFDEIITIIKSNQEFEIKEGSLIIFDEIQLLPHLILILNMIDNQAISKYKIVFVCNHFEDFLNMPINNFQKLVINPLSFEEYLINLNLKDLIDELKYFSKTLLNFSFTKIRPFIHKILIDHFRSFLLIGGMPEVVKFLLSNYELKEVKTKRMEIIKVYETIIASRQLTRNHYNQPKAYQVYIHLSDFFDRKNSSCQLSKVDKNASNKNYKDPINLLVESKFIYKLNQLKDQQELQLKFDKSKFKIYFNDFGFINDYYDTYHYNFWNGNEKLKNVRKSLGINFAINEIANYLSISNECAYYRFNHQNNYYEIDLLIKDKNENLIPIQIETSEKVPKQSMNKYIGLYKPKKAIVFSLNNFSKDEVINVGHKTIIYKIPLYVIGFLKYTNGFLNLSD